MTEFQKDVLRVVGDLMSKSKGIEITIGKHVFGFEIKCNNKKE